MPTTRGGLATRAIEVLQAPVRIAEIDVHTSPSIGIAFYPHDGNTIEALIAHADAAMYCAKQRGRGMRAMLRRRHERRSRTTACSSRATCIRPSL